VKGEYPHPSSAAVTQVMKGNRRANTKPEVALRSALHRRGLRFRKDTRIVTAQRAVRPDIVFPRQKVAVFVDGCYWHCCPEHGNTPKVNTSYWGPKFARTMARDRSDAEALEADGWHVIRLWEHVPIAEATDAVESVVRTGPTP
jgi:DNA mismatch endonuclease (patch repair protein)